jgi:hypothetical protein
MAGVLELLILCLLVYYLVPRFTTTVDAEPEPKDLDRFSEEEWNDFVRRTGVSRSYDSSGRFAPKRLFSVRAERLHDVCQRVNRLVEGDGTTIEARSKNVSQSLATDKGGQMSGGGGVPGGQGSIVAALGKQKSQDTSSAQDGKTEDERHRSRFIAMELFLHTDWLELSQDCKDFFASTPTHKSLDTALRDFQKDFGLHFYQAVELGVSREKISAMSQDNRSQTSNEDRSRQLQLEVTGQGPCANAGAGAHRNTDRHVGDSSNAFVGNKGVDQYSHGGAANLAYVDDTAWRTSLLDPTFWVVLPDGVRHPTPCLHLVRDIAEREASRNTVARNIQQRSSGLISYLQNIEKQQQEELQRQAIAASERTLYVHFEMDDQAIDIYTPADISLATIKVTLRSGKGSRDEFECEATATGVRGQFKMSSKSPYAKGVVEINAKFTFSSGWTPFEAAINGGIDSFSINATSGFSFEPRIELAVGGAGLASFERHTERATTFERGASFSESPPRCDVTAILSSGRGSLLGSRGGSEPSAVATIRVRSKDARNAILGASVPSSPRRLTGVEDALVSAVHR